MPDVRETIVAAVKTRFQAILVSGGYRTNLGNNVFLWRNLAATPLDANELPGINIKDTKCASDQNTSHVQIHNLLIEVEGLAASSATPTDIRKMISDLQQAILVDRSWGIYNVDTRPIGDAMDIQHKEDVVGGFRYQFTIIYRTLSFRPDQSA
jgi:hypothetical protein